ncbi:MAG: right-handed parallel beta-helix repeat-containing protein [Cyclobacteriaceae bacterium]|nr:right-handed parallel beta-helix repeat-containing protein [Cyclobacteriaceae bacterium]
MMKSVKKNENNRRRIFMKTLSAVGIGLGLPTVVFAQKKSADLKAKKPINRSTIGSVGGYYNVRDFGAMGEGSIKDVGAIQDAINKCKENGGGTIYFPSGNYVSGTIWFHDNMTVHIDSGAVILESFVEGMERTVRASRSHLFFADGANNIAVTGLGSIRGQAKMMMHDSTYKERGFRSSVLYFRNCTNVKIKDISIFDSDAWTVHLQGCTQAFIDSITIKNDKRRRMGNDGIDINSCKYVHISNCHIVTSDDCIVLKTNNPDNPDCENIVVNNCTLETMCTAIKFGSETHRDFRDIVFSNCIIKDTSQGLSIVLVDGATIERVTFTNIFIHNVDDHWRTPVYPVLFHVSQRKPESRLGKIRDLTLNNINVDSNYSMVIQGTEKSNIENLKIQNINFRVNDNLEFVPRRMNYKYGPKFGAEQMVENEYNEKNFHPAYINVSHVTDLDIENIRIYLTKKAETNNERAGVSLDEVDKARVVNCFVRSGNKAINDLHTTDTELLDK